MMSGVAVDQRPRRRPTGDVQPVEHETRDRIITGLVTALPLLALVSRRGRPGTACCDPATWWSSSIVYVLTGLGVTVGFHRLLTHRSFKTEPAVRGAAGDPRLGGDRGAGHLLGGRPPQAPRLLRPARATRTARTSTTAAGWRGALRGLLHAHVGWLFRPRPARRAGALRARPARRPDDPLRRPHVRGVGARRPGGPVRARLAIGGTLAAGADRAAVGRRRADASSCTTSPTASTRSATSSAAGASRPPTSRATCSGWRCLPSARPGTTTITPSRPRPRHGLGRWQLDPSALVIRALERCGLAWDVVRVEPERQRKAALVGSTRVDELPDRSGTRRRRRAAPRPWQFLVRAARSSRGLTLLLVVDVHGVGVLRRVGADRARAGQRGVATLVYWRRGP